MVGPFLIHKGADSSLSFEPCLWLLQWHCLPRSTFISSSHRDVRSSLRRHPSGSNSPLALRTINLVPLNTTIVSEAVPSLLLLTHYISIYMMSQRPYCPNKLSPWARIRYIDEIPEVGTFPQAGSESTENDKSFSPDLALGKSWKQRFTNAGSKGFSRGRRTSFASSQQYGGKEDTAHTKPLDREASGAEVERLLHLRRQKMKAAHRIGDELEVHRLQNLGLFDDIDTTDHDEDLGDQSLQEAGARSELEVDGSIGQPTLVTQGHTADLCWYMKTQEANGVMIPTDFSICAMHPSLEEPNTPSTLQKSNLTSSSLSSLRSSTQRASTSSRASTTHTSTWLDSDVSSLHSKASFGPYPLSTQPLTTLPLDDDDPFLYIGKDIHNNTRTTTTHGSKTDTNTTPPPCSSCPNHPCRSYLSGKPSQHCPTCKLPKPQPEIQAAISRIEAYRNCPSSVFDSDGELNEATTTSESLQEDLMLVEMYNAEMETRSLDGVWWEGWLVVEELKSKGIVGSRLEG